MRFLLSFFLLFLAASSFAASPRIISLYPAHTENIVSLGGADMLIGISKSDTFPAEILDKTRFSYREDPEKFIAARPDIVLIRPMIEYAYPQFVQKLRGAGIAVHSFQPRSIEEMYAYWERLGALIGRADAALQMKRDFQGGLQDFAQKLASISLEKRKKVYFEAIHRRMKTFAASSMAMFVLEQAGGINVAKDAAQVRKTNIADYGKERILSKASQIDVFLAQSGRMNPITKEDIIKESGFMAIKAVREDEVYLVEEEIISRPTIRILHGVERVYRFLYGEKS